MIDLEQKIIERFRLFQGLRSLQQDNEILELLVGSCLDETIRFLEQETSLEEQNILLEKLNSIEHSSGSFYAHNKEVIRVFSESLQKVPALRFRLEKRLEAFLNNTFTELMIQA